MCINMKKNDDTVAKDVASAKKAELQERLDNYFKNANPLVEQRLPEGTVRGRYGIYSLAEPEELPPGIEKEGLRKRNVLYRGPMDGTNGRRFYLFVVRERDDSGWGTSIAIESNEMPLLEALDRKLARLQ